MVITLFQASAAAAAAGAYRAGIIQVALLACCWRWSGCFWATTCRTAWSS
ncbi:hypothetical protein [Salmonella enterica]